MSVRESLPAWLQDWSEQGTVWNKGSSAKRDLISIKGGLCRWQTPQGGRSGQWRPEKEQALLGLLQVAQAEKASLNTEPAKPL